MNIAILFAGGSGTRMGSSTPKQFLKVQGKPILVHTIELFQNHSEIDKIYVVTIADYIRYVEKIVNEYGLTKVCKIVSGGSSAQESIYNGLTACSSENPDDSVVLLHDGVRPFITPELISENIKTCVEKGNAITTTSCFETILLSKDGEYVEQVPYRKDTFAAQAPQTFVLKDILDAHNKVRSMESGYENLVDACTICHTLGIPVHMVEGNRGNIKVTTPIDVYMFKALLEYKEGEENFR